MILSWRCTLCGDHIETVGIDHAHPADLTTLGYEGLGHVEVAHGVEVESYLEVIDLFEADRVAVA